MLASCAVAEVHERLGALMSSAYVTTLPQRQSLQPPAAAAPGAPAPAPAAAPGAPGYPPASSNGPTAGGEGPAAGAPPVTGKRECRWCTIAAILVPSYIPTLALCILGRVPGIVFSLLSYVLCWWQQ